MDLLPRLNMHFSIVPQIFLSSYTAELSNQDIGTVYHVCILLEYIAYIYSQQYVSTYPPPPPSETSYELDEDEQAEIEL